MPAATKDPAVEAAAATGSAPAPLQNKVAAAPDPAGDGETAARLRIVVARLSRRLKPTEAAGALTTTEVDVLGIVAREREAPVKLTELAGLAGLNPTMLSRMVGKLEAQGLLRRYGDPADGRVWRVELTPAGSKLHEKVRKERARRLAHELDLMAPGERQAIVQALGALEALAERLLQQ
jgi:DNA-binding MarR family transcriptional regulator